LNLAAFFGIMIFRTSFDFAAGVAVWQEGESGKLEFVEYGAL
jgi:hypothetical protein